MPEEDNIILVQFETCATCRFFVPEQTLCRRYPPTVFIMGGDMNGVRSQSFFPPASDNMWCGEWSRRT
jgi:hypothetical protein